MAYRRVHHHVEMMVLDPNARCYILRPDHVHAPEVLRLDTGRFVAALAAVHGRMFLALLIGELTVKWALICGAGLFPRSDEDHALGLDVLAQAVRVRARMRRADAALLPVVAELLASPYQSDRLVAQLLLEVSLDEYLSLRILRPDLDGAVAYVLLAQGHRRSLLARSLRS